MLVLTFTYFRVVCLCFSPCWGGWGTREISVMASLWLWWTIVMNWRLRRSPFLTPYAVIKIYLRYQHLSTYRINLSLMLSIYVKSGIWKIDKYFLTLVTGQGIGGSCHRRQKAGIRGCREVLGRCVTLSSPYPSRVKEIQAKPKPPLLRIVVHSFGIKICREGQLYVLLLGSDLLKSNCTLHSRLLDLSGLLCLQCHAVLQIMGTETGQCAVSKLV